MKKCEERMQVSGEGARTNGEEARSGQSKKGSKTRSKDQGKQG